MIPPPLRPVPTILGRAPSGDSRRDWRVPRHVDPAAVSPKAPTEPVAVSDARSIEELKKELKRRGLDSLFCFSQEDLLRRLQEDMIGGR
eukprot:g33402.t1